MNLAEIGGTYLRVADADWTDPLDSSFAQRQGGRWNAPRSHPTLYLNADKGTAHANVRVKFAGLPYGPEDLDPAEAPHLVEVAVPDGVACELRTNEGLAAVGLPVTYPEDEDEEPVRWDVCQPIGAQAYEQQHDGVACKSAAPGGIEELAWFPLPRRPEVSVLRRHEFPDWYWQSA
jgi:hypothetical protein